MTEPLNNTTGPVMQERSTPEAFRMVKQRAKQASSYYNNVGLANGNLKIENEDSTPKHWPLASDRRRGSADVPVTHNISKSLPRSQPSTPVRLASSKLGVAMVKPKHAREDGDSEDHLLVTKAQTLTRRIRAQDRVIESSSNSHVSSSPTKSSPLNKTGDSLSRSMCSSSPERRNSPDKKHDGSGEASGSPSKHRDNPDYTIVYKLPNVKPKKLIPKERSHYYETIQLPPANERSKSPTHSSANEHTEPPNISQSVKSKSSHASSPSHFPRSQTYTGKTLAHADDIEVHPITQDLRRNKTTTTSESSSPEKHTYLQEIPNLSVSSAGGSPVTYRRNKAKSRSKSDVVDHLGLINRLQDIENPKDAQRMFEQHFELTIDQIRRRRHKFSHYDWQSMLFSFNDVLVSMETLKSENTPSGASKAAAIAVSAASNDSLVSKPSSMDITDEDVSMQWEIDQLEANRCNDLVASCPYFRNEIGGEEDRDVCVASSAPVLVQVRSEFDATTTQAQSVLTNHTYLSIVEHGASGLLPPHSPPSHSVSFGVEGIDRGAEYYRQHFYEKEHQNLVGIDERYGPIVISCKREKIEDGNGGSIYQYRIIIRTSELCTLRGSILEDVIEISRHPPSKGYPAKDVVEYICPELAVTKLSLATSKIQDQIMKVDEHNIRKTYKVGVLYCKAKQTTEEDMYNNEHASPAFEQFLNIIGHKVKLNGFDDFKGGLDIVTDSTGTESVFTTFKGYKIMFHVSTLLPFTANNRQQLLRKRHIGNDIVTIVFQEPGSEPFNPQEMHSHFQHVFIVVRVHNPCSNNTCYSVAVTRFGNIARFGPPIQENSMVSVSSTFREFLLTKVINGENTAHMAGKFKALAMKTREQYLRDLTTYIQKDSNQKPFTRISISASSRKMRDKDKQKVRLLPEQFSLGGLTWTITVNDYSRSEVVTCHLSISDCVLLVVEVKTKKLIFAIPCQAVLGWSVPPPTPEQLSTYERDIHIYYGRGERISIGTDDVDSRDEIILRLERFTKGSETVYRSLRRNKASELGFNVNYEGIVMEVDPNGCAALDGIKQSSRLVEICKVSVATMTHGEIIDLLRTSDRVTVVIIPPNDDGTPRKCSMELYHLTPVLESKAVDLKTVIVTPWVRNRSSSSAKRKQFTIGEEKITRRHRISSNSEAHTTGKGMKSHLKKHFSQKSSGSKTQETLLATATKLAMVGFAAGHLSPQDNSKDSHNVNNHSSATNTMSSTSTNPSSYSGADVDWNEGSLGRKAGYGISSDSGINSNNNNNSSYSSSLSRCSAVSNTQSDVLAVEFVDKRKPIVLTGNENNNNNSYSYSPRLHYKPVKSESTVDTVCNFNPDFRSDVNVMLGRATSSEFSQSSSVYETGLDEMKHFHQSKKTARVSSHPYSSNISSSKRTKSSHLFVETSNKSFYNLFNRNRSASSSEHIGPRLKSSSARDRIPSQPTVDVQTTLIRLLTPDSPKKKKSSSRVTSPTRKTPVRSSSQRSSPRRKTPSPFSSTASTILYRSASDENLPAWQAHQDTNERASVTGGASHLHHTSLDTRSLLAARKSFPLPDGLEWENLVDAANAAEEFHDYSARDVRASILRWDERRLERIEREMKLLQEELKAEQDSKKALEEEVSSLRRDNTLLLQQVRCSNPKWNGIKKNLKISKP